MRAILVLLLSLAFVACGDSGGVKARLHERTKKTPPDQEQKALSLLGQGSLSSYNTNRDSVSSQLIRSTVLGVRMQLTALSNTKTNLEIMVSETYGVGQCTLSKFSGEFDNSKAMSWLKIENLGHLTCMSSSCSYALLVLESGTGSATTSGGDLIPAAVPVILEDLNKDRNISLGLYAPTTSEDSVFLTLPQEINTTCLNPVKVTQTTAPVLPMTDNGSSDDYFPDDDYNEWF